MPIRELAAMSYEEVRDLRHGRTIAVLPVGAIEAHGPHLPLATDVVIAEAMARAGAARIEALGGAAVVLPPFVFTAAPFAAGFAGTLSFTPEIVTMLLLDLARELTRQGFAALAVANAHLDPAHLTALAEVVARARDNRFLRVVCPDLTRKPWASRLTEEFKSGACHAGRFETSILLAERPKWVRDPIRKALAPNPASLSDAIRGGARHFEEAGGPRAYFGWPADATSEEGRTSTETLGQILTDAVREALAGKGAE
jgi:creatinine amidohydrolase